MFGDRLRAGFEHQSDARAVEALGGESGVGRGDRQVQAVVGQDAIAQVEPQRPLLPRRDGKRQVDHVTVGPDRVLDADVERDRLGAGQRGQVDRDAVQPVAQILPAVIEGAGDRLVGQRIAQGRRDQDMDDRRHAGGARHGAATARRAGAHRSLYARGRHRDDRRPLVGGVAAGDEAVERRQRGERRRHVGPDRIVELEAARRFGAGADVIGPQLLDRLFLHHVGEVQRATGAGRELIDAAHHALRPGGEKRVLAVTRPAEAAIGRAAQFDAVEAFARRHGQVVALAAFDIDVPVGQLEIIVATGQARPVVDAGPRRFGDAVDALPHPLLQVLRICEFDLAHAGNRRVEQRRQAFGPAVAV